MSYLSRASYSRSRRAPATSQITFQECFTDYCGNVPVVRLIFSNDEAVKSRGKY